MFTGLIEAVGVVRGLARTGAGARLEIEVSWPHGEAPPQGDSVAVDGACLTVLEPADTGFAADLSPETVDRTLLGALRAGDRVNLERALRLGDRLGGHLVQGHVDALTRILAIQPEGGFSRWRLSVPSEQAGELAAKGSVAVHGVSLTVATIGSDWFEVALIPETLRATNLEGQRVGAQLHLETDVLAKYVTRSLSDPGRSAIDEVFGGGTDGA
jgi:riboflavin synthase